MRQRRSFNIVTFLAIVVFLGVLGLSGGVFFYKQFKDKQLETKKVQLNSLKNSFSEVDIRSIRNLEKRLNGAEELIGKHISLSRVFDVIADRTQKQSQLKKFSFLLLPSGSAEVTMSGGAKSFNTVALQKRAFSTEKTFKEDSVIFSHVNVTEAAGKPRTVTFDVAARLDASAIAYRIASSSDAVTQTFTGSTTPSLSFTATTSAQMASSTHP